MGMRFEGMANSCQLPMFMCFHKILSYFKQAPVTSIEIVFKERRCNIEEMEVSQSSEFAMA